MTASVHVEPAAFSDFNIDLDHTARPARRIGDFRWEGDILVQAGGTRIDCSNFNNLEPEVAHSLREHLLIFSSDGKYSSATFTMAVRGLRSSLSIDKTRFFDKAWLMKALSLPTFLTHKGTLCSFFIYWNDRFPGAISDDALQFFARRTPRPKRSKNVLSDDPEESWLTDLEFELLLQHVWQNYDQGITSTQITLLRLLSMQYARRPVQLANLKIGDFRDDLSSSAGVSGRRVHFPGAKDRQSETNFRDSKVEVHPIGDHLWDLFQIQKHEARQLFESVFDFSVTELQLGQLPAFIDKQQLKKAIDELTSHYDVDWRENLDSRLFHMSPAKAGLVIGWHRNTPINVESTRERGATAIPPYSHRTGEPIRVTATRLRHTRARQLARLGMPKPVLSFWLGHTHEVSLDAYYNDPAEEARKINEAMSGALTHFAMSFTGKLLDNESQATRPNDPDSTLEFADGKVLKNVGKCGKHSFCSTTTVPVPCYRCKHFEPLVYAPHDEVLNALLVRQSEENAMIKIGGSRKLLIPIDLSADIRAVQACIARCDARKAELEAKNG